MALACHSVRTIFTSIKFSFSSIQVNTLDIPFFFLSHFLYGRCRHRKKARHRHGECKERLQIEPILVSIKHEMFSIIFFFRTNKWFCMPCYYFFIFFPSIFSFFFSPRIDIVVLMLLLLT
jgi:hypothetical protein